MSDKKKTGKKAERKKDPLLLLIGVLCILAVGVAVYGIQTSRKDQEEALSGVSQDAIELRSLVTGDYTADIREEEGEFLICLALPEDFDFSEAILNIELSEGAVVSEKSNCWRDELAGRPIVNLTVEDASLLIENGSESKLYRFQISIL